jgi:hypothetical protein
MSHLETDIASKKALVFVLLNFGSIVIRFTLRLFHGFSISRYFITCMIPLKGATFSRGSSKEHLYFLWRYSSSIGHPFRSFFCDPFSDASGPYFFLQMHHFPSVMCEFLGGLPTNKTLGFLAFVSNFIVTALFE